jgi:hypothetical protein
VIDTEYRVLREDRPSDAVELARRIEVAAKGLLNDDACLMGQAGGAQPFDDRGE